MGCGEEVVCRDVSHRKVSELIELIDIFCPVNYYLPSGLFVLVSWVRPKSSTYRRCGVVGLCVNTTVACDKI